MKELELLEDRLHVHAFHGLPLVAPGLAGDTRHFILALDGPSKRAATHMQKPAQNSRKDFTQPLLPLTQPSSNSASLTLAPSLPLTSGLTTGPLTH